MHTANVRPHPPPGRVPPARDELPGLPAVPAPQQPRRRRQPALRPGGQVQPGALRPQAGPLRPGRAGVRGMPGGRRGVHEEVQGQRKGREGGDSSAATVVAAAAVAATVYGCCRSHCYFLVTDVTTDVVASILTGVVLQ